MSIINLGNQSIAFDYKHPATGRDFNILLRGIVKPGIYKGGTLTHLGANRCSISAFHAFFNAGTTRGCTISTTLPVEIDVTVAQPIVYMKFAWSDSIENWVDFGIRAATDDPITNEIYIGKATFSGGIVNGFDYTDRTIGLLDDNDDLQVYDMYTDQVHEMHASSGVTIDGLWIRNGIINAGVPVGTIVAVSQGYFTDGSNGGYASVSITEADSTIWKTCDGSALNDSDSPIWNAAGRYLPNLSDSRFLMGFTSAGTIGGLNSNTLSVTHIPQHAHTINHTHTTNDPGTHTHIIPIHLETARDSQDATPVDKTHSSAYGQTNIGSAFTYVATSGWAGAVTCHWIQTGNSGAHTHVTNSQSTADSGNWGTASPTALENRPLYLSVIYKIRVK